MPAGSGAEVSRRGFLSMAGFLSTGGLIFFAGKGSLFLSPGEISKLRALGDGPQGGMDGSPHFPACHPYSWFSDGRDCIDGWDCYTGFKCQGHWYDDFECTVSFTCSDSSNENFACYYSFDNEDCEGLFECESDLDFTCVEGYTQNPV